MVNQRRLFEGYILIFIAVFIFSIIYPMIPTAVNSVSDIGFQMPQNDYTTAMNSTMGIQSVSSSLSLLGMTVVIGIIVVILLGSFGMARGASAF